MNDLTIGKIFNEGIGIALKNVASIFGAVILWALTIWIPYINVGTTIAISTLPMELAKGNVMSPTAIFDPKYRTFMGEYFVTIGLMMPALMIASAFLFVPAIIIGLAWSLALFLVLDKGLNPAAAITESNKLTKGYKWTMLFGKLALMAVPYVVMLIGLAIMKSSVFIGGLIALIGAIVLMPMSLAADAVVYKALVLEADANAEVAPEVE